MNLIVVLDDRAVMVSHSQNRQNIFVKIVMLNPGLFFVVFIFQLV